MLKTRESAAAFYHAIPFPLDTSRGIQDFQIPTYRACRELIMHLHSLVVNRKPPRHAK